MVLSLPNFSSNHPKQRFVGSRLLTLSLLTLLAGSAALAADPTTAPASKPMTAEQVLKHLDVTVDWYRRVTSIDTAADSTEEVLFRETVRKSAQQALHLGFDFARTEAQLLVTTDPKATASASSKQLYAAATKAAQQATDLQTRLVALDTEIKASGATTQPSQQARRDKLVSELTFVNAQKDVIQNLVGFVSGVESGHSGTLSDEIDELERSVPDAPVSTPATAANSANATATAAPAANAPTIFRAESTGIMGLISEMLTISRRMSELNHVTELTENLVAANDSLRAPLRTELKNASARGTAIGALPNSNDADKLNAEKRELDALAVRFREIAGAAVPLREQSASLEAARANLLEWHAALDRVYSSSLHFLVLRVGGLVGAIVVVLGISVLWKRATFRYVTDSRRRRQFLVLRRVVAGSVIAIIAVVSFVSEFGSLATYAGLLTAGIAVALQSIILSGVAYFFFVGRYGVRVGDRITIAGVTGDVIDIGLFRLYLMELSGNRDMRPSGRVVVFSNAVLFQPSPFFKQLPGADYVWHQVALTLSPDSDYNLAEARLLAAVNVVFETYRKTVEAEYADVQRTSHLTLPPPKPEAWLRFVDSGLEFVVRYPVEIARAPEIDDQVTRSLLKTIENEPALRMVPSSPAKIQASIERPGDAPSAPAAVPQTSPQTSNGNLLARAAAVARN